ncbi:MAG: HAD hydrolase-like protein, partial [Verrucomicrobia bacterium]|nr:HAD hydrolase-like protein [Verrucomicrobiota bacterium]
LLEATRALDISPGESFMIGDKESDIAAGLNAGVKACVWITEAANVTFANWQNVWVAPDFQAAADLILGDEVPKV